MKVQTKSASQSHPAVIPSTDLFPSQPLPPSGGARATANCGASNGNRRMRILQLKAARGCATPPTASIFAVSEDTKMHDASRGRFPADLASP